jgi:hypothetical protein
MRPWLPVEAAALAKVVEKIPTLAPGGYHCNMMIGIATTRESLTNQSIVFFSLSSSPCPQNTPKTPVPNTTTNTLTEEVSSMDHVWLYLQCWQVSSMDPCMAVPAMLA